MKRYRLVGIEVPDNAEVNLDDNLIPLNVFYNLFSGKLTFALLEPLEEPESPLGEISKVEEAKDKDTKDKTEGED